MTVDLISIDMDHAKPEGNDMSDSRQPSVGTGGLFRSVISAYVPYMKLPSHASKDLGECSFRVPIRAREYVVSRSLCASDNRQVSELF